MQCLINNSNIISTIMASKHISSLIDLLTLCLQYVLGDLELSKHLLEGDVALWLAKTIQKILMDENSDVRCGTRIMIKHIVISCSNCKSSEAKFEMDCVVIEGRRRHMPFNTWFKYLLDNNHVIDEDDKTVIQTDLAYVNYIFVEMVKDILQIHIAKGMRIIEQKIINNISRENAYNFIAPCAKELVNECVEIKNEYL